MATKEKVAPPSVETSMRPEFAAMPVLSSDPEMVKGILVVATVPVV